MRILPFVGVFALYGGVELQAGVLFNAIDQGWWNDSGRHFEDSLNTFTGRVTAVPPPEDFNSFFVFDLSGVSGVITSGILRLQQTTYHSVDDAESFAVYDVSTPVDTLRSSGFGQTGIFLDLQSGSTYGSGLGTAGTIGTIHEIALSSAALTDLNNAVGGFFAVGLHLTDLVGPRFQGFHFADNLSDVSQLELFTAAPEPSVLGLMSLMLASTIIRSRRSARRGPRDISPDCSTKPGVAELESSLR